MEFEQQQYLSFRGGSHMKLDDREESSNVEDVRGRGRTGIALGGGGIIIVLIAIFLGVDPQKIMNLIGQPPGQNGAGQEENRPDDPATERLKHFVAVVLRDTERVWDEQFRQMGMKYQYPKLDEFEDQVRSAC